MSHKHGPVFRIKECLVCAARLVILARPSRKHQESMLVYVSRYWSRDEVIREIANANSGK